MTMLHASYYCASREDKEVFVKSVFGLKLNGVMHSSLCIIYTSTINYNISPISMVELRKA